MEYTLDQALQKGVEAHKAGKVQEADRYYTAILKANPNHPDANHNMGVLAVGIGKVETALPFFKTALDTNPNIDQFWISYIDALIKLDRLDEASEVFKTAKTKGVKGNGFEQLKKRLQELLPFKQIKKNKYQAAEPSPDQQRYIFNLHAQRKTKLALKEARKLLEQFPESLSLHNAIASFYRSLRHPELALEYYQKLLNIKPDFAEGYSNMGNALRDLGKFQEALDAYNHAIKIQPGYAVAHNNIGLALVEKNEIRKAKRAYNEAIKLAPNYTDAHRNFSRIQKYQKSNTHIGQVLDIYKNAKLSKSDLCNLSFTLAKIYDDLGYFAKAYQFLQKGNTLRKEILSYSIEADISLFAKLRENQNYIKAASVEKVKVGEGPLPIFIIGMPRSGTTLIEQIISAHSEVFGAGELNYVNSLGHELAIGALKSSKETIFQLREQYLKKISKLSRQSRFITDKMPHNFLYLPLICAAFPDAKIVHVIRDPAATCWSNYKQYFESADLGYCYDIEDVSKYFKHYRNLMKSWKPYYKDHIYELRYEKITENTKSETQALINYLGLSWEAKCLEPQDNERNVGTAASLQVRQKVYQGSSDVWRKYEPFLTGAFDDLTPW